MLDNSRNGGGGAVPDFQFYCRHREIKTVWYWYKNRGLDQRNKVDDVDLNPGTY